MFLYRNGKCLSYKKNWKEKILYSRKDVHNIFLQRLEEVFESDIRKLNYEKRRNRLYSNNKNCFLGDVRKRIAILEDNSIDLVITSPPYLNSRDYTDSYIDELRVLDYLEKYPSIQDYRSKTIRSHVQVKWNDCEPLNIALLKSTLDEILKFEKDFWNKNIPNMITGYFKDMDTLFKQLIKKVKKGGLIYFNVGNSAYFGIEIKVDEIIAQIAERNGFFVEEIRNARYIRPSSQQRKYFPYLIESVLVITKKTV